MEKEFENKIILITGGTGTFGYEMTKYLLKINTMKEIRILSRGEKNQYDMKLEFKNSKLKFIIGDIRDRDCLEDVFKDVNIVYHAAAMKQVPVVEDNPIEAIKTNILGSINVVEMAKKFNISKLIAISTDKAVSPFNLYGKTKSCMEEVMIKANTEKTKISVARYGNVFGSRGSVIPIFLKQIKNKKKITITEPEMTRFTISKDEAIKFVLDCTIQMIGGEIFVPKLKKYTIKNILHMLSVYTKKELDIQIIGSRQGEKKHELMIANTESEFAINYNNYFIIIPRLTNIYIEKYGNKIYGKEYSSHDQEEICQEEFNDILEKLLME